ncbi:MAG: hypothetical protein SVV80_09825 [Planctomycetota bacterium]|nr:hypothetical protein [Planctomycetota bacterium]
MINKKILITVLVLLTSAGSAGAQILPGEKPADSTDPGMMSLTMTPEQLEKFIEEARLRRLEMEREHVAAEIKGDMKLNFNPDKTDAALKVLFDKPKNTWEDNAGRISRAFAVVDERFGKVHAALAAGDHEGVIAAIEPFISERDTSYFAAAKRFCLAEALAGRGRSEDAVDAYADLVKTMPDRFSFSALALLRAGRTYESLNRLYYAMTLYRLWVDSFGLLDSETAKDLAVRAEKIASDYEDPLKTIAGKMDEVQKRLSTIDSGRVTQTRQKEIVAMLDDLIATAEENASPSAGGGEGKGKCEGEGEGEGEGQGEGQGKGKKSGPPRGIGIPTQGATVSQLVGGETLAPSGLREVHASDRTDDWGRLPPREQKKLMETFRETMPERYRGMIRDYYRQLASNRTAPE